VQNYGGGNPAWASMLEVKGKKKHFASALQNI